MPIISSHEELIHLATTRAIDITGRSPIRLSVLYVLQRSHVDFPKSGPAYELLDPNRVGLKFNTWTEFNLASGSESIGRIIWAMSVDSKSNRPPGLTCSTKELFAAREDD